MAKKLILAVAGSGKTTLLLNQLEPDSRTLIITYTRNNYDHLHNEIINKFGYIPNGITVLTYFEFLHSFCYKPLYVRETKTRGLYFKQPAAFTGRFPLKNRNRYITEDNWIYHNRLAKLLEVYNAIESIKKRIEKYFDAFYVDEVQDFAGHDFNFLMALSDAKVDHIYVGDFFQHTFDTSRDGAVNKNLHNNRESYIERFSISNFEVDDSTLIKSYRCSPTVCDFVSHNLGIQMESHRTDRTKVEFLDAPDKINEIIKSNNVIKLFLQEHYKYNCFSQNWGAVKGTSYSDVCVTLNITTTKALAKNATATLASGTKNKFYVACTRTQNNLYFISDQTKIALLTNNRL